MTDEPNPLVKLAKDYRVKLTVTGDNDAHASAYIGFNGQLHIIVDTTPGASPVVVIESAVGDKPGMMTFHHGNFRSVSTDATPGRAEMHLAARRPGAAFNIPDDVEADGPYIGIIDNSVMADRQVVTR